ncbi:MAG: hypothetical protein Q9209_005641 [Squamulea sp. 1 TL-2023]
MAAIDPDFPCSLVIAVPLPTHRLASSALRALQVDAELSPLVCRSMSLVSLTELESAERHANAYLQDAKASELRLNGEAPLWEKTILRTEYRATTNRMLRVSVNGFFESMGLVLGVMQELDVDVLAQERRLAQSQLGDE